MLFKRFIWFLVILSEKYQESVSCYQYQKDIPFIKNGMVKEKFKLQIVGVSFPFKHQHCKNNEDN